MIKKSFNCFEFKVTLASVDCAGRIFYSRLFEFIQSATETFLHETPLGSIDKWFLNKKPLPVIVHCQADYLIPIQLGDLVHVEIGCSKIGNSSFNLNYQFTKPNEVNPQKLAVAELIYVLTKDGREKMPLTDTWKEVLSSIYFSKN